MLAKEIRMVDKPSLSEVENAFQPAKEVTAVVRFAGRKMEVEDGYYGLLGDGVNIAIVGNCSGQVKLATGL
jgi:hypothetical protein